MSGASHVAVQTSSTTLWCARSTTGETTSCVCSPRPGKSALEYWLSSAERVALRQRFLDRFARLELDALLCPGLGLPAFPHGGRLLGVLRFLRLGIVRGLFLFLSSYVSYTNRSQLLNQACSYTFVFNLLDVPAGSVPVTLVRPDEQSYRDDARNDTIAKAARQASAGSNARAFLPKGFLFLKTWVFHLILRSSRHRRPPRRRPARDTALERRGVPRSHASPRGGARESKRRALPPVPPSGPLASRRRKLELERAASRESNAYLHPLPRPLPKPRTPSPAGAAVKESEIEKKV